MKNFSCNFGTKIMIGIGVLIIDLMVSEQAVKTVEKKVDELTENIDKIEILVEKEIKSKLEEAKEDVSKEGD